MMRLIVNYLAAEKRIGAAFCARRRYAVPKIRHSSLSTARAPLTLLQRISMALGSSVVSLSDPERSDMVAVLGETTGPIALHRMHRQMMSDAIGREILFKKPRVTELSLNVRRLRSLPANTFGAAYARFMDERGFTADSRAPVKYIEDSELAYVMQRYREVHDFWHTLSGMETTVLAEIAVKWLEMVQTGLPMTALSAFLGPLRLSCRDSRILSVELIPWAWRCGTNCKPLMSIFYEEHFDQDLDEFRKELHFEPFVTESVRAVMRPQARMA